MEIFPDNFLQRLKQIIPQDKMEAVVDSFSLERQTVVRINDLKAKEDEILKRLTEQKIQFERVPWYPKALLVKNISIRELSDNELVQTGMLYIQSLSSILVPLILDPKPNQLVLDLCAAPGSKASQIASLMNNKGKMVCIENIKERFYKLKSVVEKLGATVIKLSLMDGRKYRGGRELFDRILVDAPCSSEGRFKTYDKKTLRYWSIRKIKEMAHKQKGLLLNASRLLKPGGMLVYSTCTFAPEENEAVIHWLLTKTKGAIEVSDISFKDIKCYPSITEWNEKKLDQSINKCIRILPSDEAEGFFISKMKKVR